MEINPSQEAKSKKAVQLTTAHLQLDPNRSFYVNRNYDIDISAFADFFDIGKESVRKIEEMSRSVIELYVLFGMLGPQRWRKVKTGVVQHLAHAILRQKTNHLLYRTVYKVCTLEKINGEGTWAKFFKWKFAAYFAYKMQQDIPKKPDFLKSSKGLWSCKTILGGYGYDFEYLLEREKSLNELLNSLLVSWLLNPSDKFAAKLHDFDSFLDTSQQLKKAAPDVPDSMVIKAMDDTVKELTSVPKVTADSVILFAGYKRLRVTDTNRILDIIGPRRLEINQANIIRELQRTVDEIFDDEFISYKDLVEPFFPSTSANYIMSRSNLGSLAVLYDYCSFGKMGDGIMFGEELRPLVQRVAPHFGVLGDQE